MQREELQRRHSQAVSPTMATSFTTPTGPLLAFPPTSTRAPAVTAARASVDHTSTTTTTITTLVVSGHRDAAVSSNRGRGNAKLETESLLASVKEDAGREDEGHGGQESWSRRGLLGAAALAMVVSCANLGCEPAQAFEFSLGISGPKDWLKGQKRKTAQFLLNPIEASRSRLSSAVLLLSSAEGSSFENYEEAGKLVKVAARDCTPNELGSILDFQTRTGVEVCTFKLVLKNAASLLSDDDPVKVSAVAALNDLIRSFTTVDQLLSSGGASAATQREDVMGALKQTMAALDTFQQGVQNCLDI